MIRSNQPAEALWKGAPFSWRRPLLASTLLTLYASTLSAAPAPLSEDAYLDEMPVVLTVSRLAQPLNEAPAAVTVIDRQMIKDSGAWELADVFRLVPGMYVAYHGADMYATENIVSYHGLSDTYSRRMQVLVDGRSVYSPLFGGMLWNNIPLALDDIERIEVIRGPNSAGYGANSFLGIINIITRHSAEEQGNFVSLSKGRNREEAIARHGGRNGDLTYRVTAGVRNDQGEDPKIVNFLTTVDGWDNNKRDNKKIRLLTFRADYRVDPANEMEVQLGYNGGPREEGWPNGEFSVDKQVDNYFELGRWRRTLDSGGELAVQAYHAVENSSATLFNTRRNRYEKIDVTAERYDLEAQHTFAPSSTTRLVWGGSVRYDSTYAPFYLGGDLRSNPFHLSRLFGNLEWRAGPQVVVNLGAMAERNSTTGTDVTPRAAVNWHFLPGHTLRASYSTATRTPTVYEKSLEQPFLGTFLRQELQPEHVESTEVGYLGDFPGLKVDFRLFQDHFRDLIAENQSALLHGNLNSGKAVVEGGEAQFRWDIGERTRLIYSLSHVQIRSDNQDGIPYRTAAPENSHSLLLSHSFGNNWRASLAGYQVGANHLPEADSGPDQNRRFFIDQYRRWDARLAYHFRAPGSGRGEVALVVQNLDDTQYFEFRHDNEPPGRSAWVNLTLEF